MKKILLIICLFPILVFSQKSYKIPADSTILNNIGSGKNELVIRNATSNITGGVLTNLGNGVTAFVLGGNSARVVDTIYKNNTKDSIVFTISGIRYAVKDSFNLNTDSQTLSISNDTLTISGGNSVILPVYIQIDSSTINSYDVLNSQNAPPGSPSTGDVYLVGTVPTGVWVGQAKDIAEWNGSAWVFTDGVQGDFLYNSTTALMYIFRSGNWVQTTGIPALNNGNTISSGLRIGTNNARSLTFETNNANRGRFDSIGRFHVYNLPTSSTSDTFVTKSDLSGKLTKVGESTFLSGVNTDAQTLTAGVNTLTISGGNTVDLNRKVDTSYSFRNTSLDSICQIVIINGNPTRSCIKESTGGGGSSLSGLTAATATNTINNAANVQEWQWNSLTSGSGFILKSNNSGLAGATSSVLEVNSTGSSAVNNTTNALKLVNNRSGAGTNVGADITVSGNVGAIGLNITNATTSGMGINLTSGMAQGIQMNNNMLAFSTTPHSIKYNGSYFHINSASSRTFFTATGTSNYWAFCTSDASNFFTINRVANGSYALIFGGDYPGAYRSELTSNNVIKASNGSLTICGNTGLAGGFGGFTPTEIITVYGTNTNVGIGTTTPVASAILDLTSTTKGLAIPTMTATQASAISTPKKSLMIYVTDTNGTFTSAGWWGYNGTIWKLILAE